MTQTNNMPLGIGVTFLGAAMWGYHPLAMDRPMTLEELAAKVGMTPTTVSQHLRYLSYGYRVGKPGLGLVETAENTDNRRKKVFFLTPDGRALIAELEEILSGPFELD